MRKSTGNHADQKVKGAFNMDDYIVELHVTMVVEAENKEHAELKAVNMLGHIPEVEDATVKAVFGC